MRETDAGISTWYVRSSFVVQSFILSFPLCAMSAAVFEIACPPHLHSAGRDPPPLAAVTFSGLDGARRGGGGGEGGGATRALLRPPVFDIATGQRDGSGEARETGRGRPPRSVSRLNIIGIFYCYDFSFFC